MTSKKSTEVIRKTESSIEAAYRKCLADIASMTHKFYGDSLDYCWLMGSKVDDATTKPDKYGHHTVEELAQDLMPAKAHLSATVLYTAQDIYRNISKEQLAMAKTARLPVQALEFVARRHLSPELKDRVLQDAIKASDAGARMRAVDVKKSLVKLMGTKNLSGKDQELGRAIKRLNGIERIFVRLTETMNGISDWVSVVCDRGSEPRIREACESINNCTTAFDDLSKVVGAQLAKSRKILPHDNADKK